MRLTRRGEMVLLLLMGVVLTFMLAAAYDIGQHEKDQRQQDQHGLT